MVGAELKEQGRADEGQNETEGIRQASAVVARGHLRGSRGEGQW